MNSAIEAILPILHNHHSFVLTTHVNPDGDGLGSEVALAEWLAANGKQVTILNYSSTPDVYLFLDPNRRIKQFSGQENAETILHADVIVILDTNQPDRLREMQSHVLTSEAIKICIDHHLDPHPFAGHYVIDDNATSTGEILYRILVRLNGKQLSPLIAQALYCAIMTDTGSFHYPRVDPEIFQIASHLTECGADPVAIFQNVYEQWSPGRIQLLGACLAGLETFFDNRLASITITQEMLKKTGTKEEDTDNFTTYPMSIEGVIAGILFLELNDGVKISFRSKGDVRINELAREFGGGGHKNAAGARIYNVALESARQQVFSAARKYVDNTVVPIEPFNKA